MIKRPIVEGTRNAVTGEARLKVNCIAANAIEELVERGAAMPDIKNVIFNRCDKKIRAVRDKDGNLVIDPATGKPERKVVANYPILATTVYFVDGSKVSVTNSEKDKVVDENGNVTKEARERGVVYAIVKRLLGKFEKNEKTGKLEVKTEGFGRILEEILANAYDQQKAEAEHKAAKEAARKAHLEREAAAKANPRKRRPSLAATVEQLAATVADLTKMVTELKASKEA